MITKITEAACIARLGIPVRIVQAGTPHALAACRAGALPARWVGTQVLPAGAAPV